MEDQETQKTPDIADIPCRYLLALEAEKHRAKTIAAQTGQMAYMSGVLVALPQELLRRSFFSDQMKSLFG